MRLNARVSSQWVPLMRCLSSDAAVPKSSAAHGASLDTVWNLERGVAVLFPWFLVPLYWSRYLRTNHHSQYEITVWRILVRPQPTWWLAFAPHHPSLKLHLRPESQPPKETAFWAGTSGAQRGRLPPRHTRLLQRG